ncbi:VOC family protein [Bradyrhizobium manausense]|nr:VOC family protein [Bradyrhizobium manausense]
MRDELFWTQVRNAPVSVLHWRHRAVRVNAIHHTVALAPGRGPGHQVESNDDVLRSFYHLSGQRVPIVFGPGRHPTSGARFFLWTRRDDVRVFGWCR